MKVKKAVSGGGPVGTCYEMGGARLARRRERAWHPLEGIVGHLQRHHVIGGEYAHLTITPPCGGG